MKKLYFLKADWQEEWTEISEEQFIKAEHAAGFWPKPDCGPVATAGFSSTLTMTAGKVRYADET